MPSSPEFRDAPGNIRIIKVFQEVEAEHFSETDGHIGVTREIKVDLEGVSQGSQPGSCHRKLGNGKSCRRIPEKADVIRQQDLFSHTGHKAVDAFREVIQIFPAFLHLLRNGLILYDGSCDQLRKHGNIGSIADPVLLHVRISTVNINGIGHGLEGEKGDTDRKRNIQKGQIQTADCVDTADDKIRILEKAENRQIHKDRK